MGEQQTFPDPLRPAHHRSQITTEKVVCRTHKFVYVAVPKVATRSMLSALENAPIETTRLSKTLTELYTDADIDWSYRLFSFVRNPWARLYSTYTNKIARDDERVKREVLKHFPGLHADLSFADFVDYVCHADGGSDTFGDRHWISQYLQLELPGDLPEQPSVMIGRIESLEQDLARIVETLGLETLTLPVLNSRFGWRTDQSIVHAHGYREHYNRQTAALVGERYAVDVERYGYEF